MGSSLGGRNGILLQASDVWQHIGNICFQKGYLFYILQEIIACIPCNDRTMQGEAGSFTSKVKEPMALARIGSGCETSHVVLSIICPYGT